jgi:hypothetical protein
MTGLSARIVWTRPNETGDGYLARAEVTRIADGAIVGAAESECARSESTWAKRESYALRSMAQTRATSRALRGPLGMIVTLAGYAGAAVEEMPDDEAPGSSPPATGTPAEPAPIRRDQAEELTKLIEQLEQASPGNDWRAYCRTIVGGKPGQHPDEEAAGRLLVALREKVKRLDYEGK